jgi:hypothetical protein
MDQQATAEQQMIRYGKRLMSSQSMLRFLVFLLFTTVVTGATAQVRRATVKEETGTVVATAVERLNGRVSVFKLQSLRSTAQTWRSTSECNSAPTTDLVQTTDQIQKLARESNTRCEVTIAASGGAGATIKIQSLGERRRNEPPTTAGMSTVTEPVYIGRYHVWAERGGRATSDKAAEYNLLDKKKQMVLVES